jgi:hypothetical protein
LYEDTKPSDPISAGIVSCGGQNSGRSVNMQFTLRRPKNHEIVVTAARPQSNRTLVSVLAMEFIEYESKDRASEEG